VSVYSIENPLFTPIFDHIFGLVSCNQSSIYLLDGADLKYVASRGQLPPEQIEKLNFPLEKSGGAKLAIENDTPVLVADVKGDALLAKAFQESAKAAPDNTYDFIGSWIGFPLHVGGQTIALLDVCHSERNYFTKKHVKLLYDYICEVEPSIENAILFKNLSQQSSELQILYAIQQAIYSHLDLSNVLQMIADQAQGITSAKQIVIFQNDSEKLKAIACSGEKDSVLKPGFILPLESSLVKNSIETLCSVRVVNIHRDDRIDTEEAIQLGIKSFLVVPLKTASQPNGVILAIGRDYGAFSPNDERVLSMLANGATTVLEKAQMYHEEQERRYVAEGLQTILAQLSSNNSLHDILEGVLEPAVKLFRADTGLIQLTQGDKSDLEATTTFNLPLLTKECIRGLMPVLGILQAKNPIIHYSDNKVVEQIDLNELFKVKLPEIKSMQMNGNPDYLNSDKWDEIERASQQLLNEYTDALHISLTVKGDNLGSIDLFWKNPQSMSPETFQLAETVARYIGITIDRDRLSRKAEELVRLQERQRIAQTLHDTVTQLLFRMGLEVKWCLQNLAINPEAIKRIQFIQHLITRSSYEMRSAIFALSNHEVHDDSSLVELVTELVEAFQNEFGIHSTFIATSNLGSIPSPVTEAVFQIVREALSNISKHSDATAALVSLQRSDNTVSITIQDNGLGLLQEGEIEVIEPAMHFGINSMKQLVTSLNGGFYIYNNDDNGVTVKAVFPV
jgi:signal transduction histidine kinase